MDALEGLQKFFASYPAWARVVAGAGLATTFFTLLLAPRGVSGTEPKPAEDAWLIVKGVEMYGPYRDAQVKVTAIVNGTEYLYPSVPGVDWLAVGPTMAPQQFKLPRPGPDGYEIRFNMLLRESARPEAERSYTSVKSAFVRSLPFDGGYELHLVQRGVRGHGVAGKVRFSVTSNPNI
ncbi:MAG TPA: hypothetical protein VNA69_19980 [Thermoanaerobaculia bacterium]|nr:hypothetical protein [Thermoanaerobaculia bacterium]